MPIIVGLGNPGAQYEVTRHNVGHWVIRKASQDWSIPLVVQRWGAIGAGRLSSEPVLLVIPASWMNMTGEVLRPLLESLGSDTSHLIVVHDDLDLPVGRLRIRQGGGDGGHNGLRSIDTCLGSNAYGRVKIGIGRPGPGQDTADFVLSPVPPDDLPIIEDVLSKAVNALRCIVAEGIDVAMNLYNRRIVE